MSFFFPSIEWEWIFLTGVWQHSHSKGERGCSSPLGPGGKALCPDHSFMECVSNSRREAARKAWRNIPGNRQSREVKAWIFI